MGGPRKPVRSVLERLSWGISRDPCEDEIVATEDGLAGVIFMCNKETKKQCFSYGVFGLPEARQDLVEQVVPGMKLFLFEYESRTLSGVFEATSHGGKDFEPHAFPGHQSAFPAQVYFREVMKCWPLSEREFKPAIYQNYFNPVKFNLDLSVDQVKNLIKFFQRVKLPETKVRDLKAKSRTGVNGMMEFQIKDSKHASDAYLEESNCLLPDNRVVSDERTRAMSAAQKRSMYVGERQVDLGCLSNVKESNSTNDVRESLESHRIPQYVQHHSLVRLRGKGNELVSTDEFVAPSDILPHTRLRGGIDHEPFTICGYETGVRATFLDSIISRSSHPIEFGIESGAPSIQDPSLSYVSRSLLRPPETRSESHSCMSQNAMDSSFLKTGLKGSEGSDHFLDVGNAFDPKPGPFSLENLYPRVGGFPPYNSIQHEKLLGLPDDPTNEGHTFPFLLQDGVMLAGQNSIPEDRGPPPISHLGDHHMFDFFGGPRLQLLDHRPVEKRTESLDVRLPPIARLDGHQGADFSAGPRLPFVNDGSVEQRALPLDMRLSEAPVCERKPPFVIQPFSHMGGIEHAIFQDDYSRMPSREIDPSSSVNDMLQRLYDLQQEHKLLHQLEMKDHPIAGSTGADRESEKYTKTVTSKSLTSGVASTDGDCQVHKLESTKSQIKQKQSVWSRLSAPQLHEIDRYPVKERVRTVEAFSSETSEFRRSDSSGAACPQLVRGVLSDEDVADEECVGHTEDTFIINFKRRKGRTVKPTEQDSSSDMPIPQRSSQPKEERDKSSDAAVPTPSHNPPKRRKLIRPEIPDPSQKEGSGDDNNNSSSPSRHQQV